MKKKGYADKRYTVYAHVHRATGKTYVGVTSQSPERRWQAGYGYVGNAPFYKDILADGWDAFDHLLIATDLTYQEGHNREEAEIAKRACTNPEKGYNLRYGGTRNVPVASVGRNISAAKMGHEVTKEVREKLSREGTRPVGQYSLDDEFIMAHQSLTEAAKVVGSNKTNLYAVCVGERKTCRGFKWKYLTPEKVYSSKE